MTRTGYGATAGVDGHWQDDLRYVPPPARPLGELHPSRMSPATALGVWRQRRAGTAERTLEELLCAASGRPACLLASSGRGALRTALGALGAGPGREVVLSTLTCPAVIDAVLATGATPVLVDADEHEGPHYTAAGLDGRIAVLTHGFGRDEHAQHAEEITRRGGTPVLDLAQALPAPEVLARFRTAGGSPPPLVLSFGEGKPLGALGGGALLHAVPWLAAPPAPDTHAADRGGAAALRRAAGRWLVEHAPGAVRAAAVRRRGRAPGWSDTKAAHLPRQPEDVRWEAPDPWQTAAAVRTLATASRRRAAAAATGARVRAAVDGRLGTCRLMPGDPDLCDGIELAFRRRGDRYAFARALAAHGVPSTWNPYPLHRMRPYARYAPTALPAADDLWRRVLTVPKQPQPRLDADHLARALLAADRAAARGETA
ncbi:DegT/DnrJ/EryC1/StrS family aminotransferase [Streptomyces sp. ODS28]|uniref:DegT/DnrJ/EryC1/StrS family aminotransferase n=1 Tax=Streptomyces sp. ODS28 TaxID=3136688 RepID=UPI0031EFD346